MEREVLFRGQCADNKEWVYGVYYKRTYYYGEFSAKDYIILSKEDLGYDQALEYYEVIPETVGEYTGVCDKNGKRIFEGDRVHCRGVHGSGVVKYDGGGFGVEYDNPIAEYWTGVSLFCLICEDGLADCIVTGNIYNKEGDNGD